MHSQVQHERTCVISRLPHLDIFQCHSIRSNYMCVFWGRMEQMSHSHISFCPNSLLLLALQFFNPVRPLYSFVFTNLENERKICYSKLKCHSNTGLHESLSNFFYFFLKKNYSRYKLQNPEETEIGMKMCNKMKVFSQKICYAMLILCFYLLTLFEDKKKGTKTSSSSFPA